MCAALLLGGCVIPPINPPINLPINPPIISLPSATVPTLTVPTLTAPAPGIVYLGMAVFPTRHDVLGTELGGLSAVAYDPTTDRFFFLSDDRGLNGPVRIYQAALTLDGPAFATEQVTWEAVIALRGPDGLPIFPGTIDPEGLAHAGYGFFVASEGNRRLSQAPAVLEFSLSGDWRYTFPIPDKFLPAPERGIRNNLAFESLALTPDKQTLITGVENALLQDGPAADVNQPSLARLLAFDLDTGWPAAEWLYPVDAIPLALPAPDATRDNGLVELLALDDHGALLAMERAYVQGVGVSARVYRVDLHSAPDVRDLLAVGDADPAMLLPAKTLLLDVSRFGLFPDNLEGMALGPRLPDGRQTLLLVSDNNFSVTQRTQIMAFALDDAALSGPP